MKLTEKIIKRLILEQLNEVSDETLDHKKFATFMSLHINPSAFNTVMAGLKKDIKKNPEKSFGINDIKAFKVHLNVFKKMVNDSYDVKFMGKSFANDVAVVKRLIEVGEEWHEYSMEEKFDDDKINRTKAQVFGLIPLLSPMIDFKDLEKHANETD